MQQYKRFQLFLLFFAGACLALPSLAQQYSYKRYTVDDGLPTNAIYGGMQDNRGYIWFYTEKGISRFDGYTFKNYTVKDGLPANDIFMLSEDSQGRLWPHSFGRQLTILDGDSTIAIAEETSPNFIRFTILSDGRNLWFAIGNPGIIVKEKGGGFDTLNINWQRHIDGRLKEIGISYPYKWDTVICFDPILAHVLKVSPARREIMEEFSMDGLSHELARLLAKKKHHSFETFNNGLFIRPFSDSTLYHLDFERKCVTPFNLVEVFGRAPEFVRYYQQDGQMQVQTGLGVVILDENLQKTDVFKAALPSSIRIDRIFKDREGNYWITSKQKGVFFLTAEERNATVIKAAAAEEGPAILCLEGDQKGNIYAGTKDGALYRLEGNRLSPLLPAPPPRYNDLVEAKAIAVTGEGGLWIGRQSIGLEYYHPQSGKLVPFSQWLEQANILYGDEQDEYFNGFGKDVLPLFIKGLAWDEGAGRLAVARGQYPFVFRSQGPGRPSIQILSSRRTHAVAYGPDGTIWMGQSDGLAVFDKKGYRYFGSDPELGKCNIWDIAVGPGGEPWIGADGYGLFVFSNGRAIHIRGTENDIVQDVFAGPKGSIWIATNQGVKSIVPGKPLENSYVERVLTTNNGLPTIEANAVFVDADFIYVGTDAGLAKISRYPSFYDMTPPSLAIGPIAVNGKVVPLKRQYNLNHRQDELEIAFTGLSYKSFGRITYEYQLEGADRELQRTGNRSIRYSGLKPGRYVLNITAIDIKGVKGPSSAPVVFTIRPPWWKSPAGIIGWILLGSFLLGAYYRRRVRSIKEKARTETEINKKFAELELQALQSQMNPHFIFNALGAIQYFIQNNDKRQADLYLAKFAYLMRLFLESSKNKYISLAEELKLIRLYVELEQLRFKNKFGFELAVDGQMDLYATLLPAMLLQPFVENAINHGLFHKEGPGLLKLEVCPAINGRIKFVIEDDGIGREQAMELRQKSDRNYKSRALQIINERLQTLRTVEDYHIDIVIEDLVDANGEAAGTKVAIEIPEIE